MRRQLWFGASALALLAGGVVLGAVASGSRAAPGTAAAQIQRTFVSTSGNDANPCTRTDPCRGFAAAIANTLAGGEVIALDSGGYGTFTVEKALTIAGAPGAHVAITAFSGVAVAVDVGTSGTVVLRNLRLTGIGALYGIRFLDGDALRVESVVTTGFLTFGLLDEAPAADLYVSDSRFSDNGAFGIYLSGTATRAEVVSTHVEGSATGLRFDGTTVATIRDAEVTQNEDFGVLALSSTVDVSDSLLADNGVGLAVALGTGRIGGSAVNGNGVGLQRGSGTLESYGDNLVRGNDTNTSGTITAVGKT
jgi:parallel beta helix pectate lyase-like protein